MGTTGILEDPEFLAASRAQQREEEIAAKERESELAREKQAREAAEAAEQIQAEANLQAQRKIRRGSLVLGGALAAALVLGGLALGSIQQLAASRQEKKQVDRELGQARNDIEAKRNELDTAIADLKQSQETLEITKTQRQEADERLKQAQQAAQGQQAVLAKLEQDLADANAAVEDAQRKAKQATDDLIAVQQERREIVGLNDTTKALSGLIDDLYAIEKPEAAQDAIAQIGLSYTDFTGDSSELKQALLNSSIALAHLNLISSEDAKEGAQEQINEAQTRIDKSVQLVENYPNVFASASGREIAFFTYAVQGNLREEQDYLRGAQEPTSARSSYEQAFRYTAETPNLNSENVADSSRQLLSSLRESSEGEQFQSLVTATLKKHYDFRARQLIRELEPVATQYHWREADLLTTEALEASAYSRDLSFSYGNISCDRLREIDTLWFDNSAGRFGFRVQKEIYEATGNIPEQWNQSSYLRFAHEVGWLGINGNIDAIDSLSDERIDWLSYDELLWSEGMDGANLRVPAGHLPLGGGVFWVRGRLGLAVWRFADFSPGLGRAGYDSLSRCGL